MAKKMWCYICDMCSIVSYQPITAPGKKKTLHFCRQECFDKWLSEKKKNAKKN